MDDIKRIFKRSIITTIVVIIYGLIIRSVEVVVGMGSGCIVSMILFYLLCISVKKIVYTKVTSYPKSVANYYQRYLLTALYLGVMAHFFGLSMILTSAIGLFNIRINIYLMVISDKLRNKISKKGGSK